MLTTRLLVDYHLLKTMIIIRTSVQFFNDVKFGLCRILNRASTGSEFSSEGFGPLYLVGLGLLRTSLISSDFICLLHKNSTKFKFRAWLKIEPGLFRALGLCTAGPGLSPGLRARA